MQCSSQDSEPSQGRAMQGYHGSSTREILPHFVHGEESNTLTVKHGGTLNVGNVNTVHVGDIIHNHVSESVQNQEDCYRSSSYREMEVDAKIEPRINEPVTTGEDGAGEADPRILQRLQQVFSSCHNPGKWEKNQKMCRELVSLFEHQGHGSLQKVGFGSVHFFVRVKLGPDHDAFLRACSDGILSRGLTKLLVTPELKKAAGVKLRVRLEVKETSNRNNISAPAGVSDSYTMPKARKTHSCTQCTYTTERSHDLKRHLSRRHGEGQSRGRESSPERTTSIRTAKQSIISSVPECQRALKKPRVTRRIVSSDSDSSKSVVIIEPSNSRTPIDKPKNEKTRKGPTSSESAVAIDNSLNEEIPKDAPPTVLCTVCGTIVNPLDRKTFFCHPLLSVVICKGCLDFYIECFWKKGKDGMEEECRWCGQGGELSLCDFCCRTFCEECIERNLGIDELDHILSKEKWKCYVCDPSPLKVLVDEFSALQARSLETEQNETEKANVYVQKEVVKAPKKEKMQDAAIAKELQYLLTNISNGALFMESLVQLKNWVPDTQNLQMLLKHIGKVKSDLGEFEACVKKQLHGDAHKSDSVLDGIPGSSSAGASQDEGGEKEDKVEKKKDLSSVTGTRKSRRSSTASESESSENSDDNTKPRRRNLSRKKKKCEPEKIDSASEVELKRRELDDNDEKDNDADGDKDDEDEEVDGTGSKRSKKKAVKKAEEDEEWNNSERRQNGTEGGGGSRDDKNGGGDQKKRKRRDPNWDLYKKAKKKKNSRKKKAQKKAKQDEDLNDSETQNGTRGGGGSGDGNNGGDE